MTTKDFTKAQAKRWVAQEFAKHHTPESIRERIESEEKAVAYFKLMDGAMPNSLWAHGELLRRLRATWKCSHCDWRGTRKDAAETLQQVFPADDDPEADDVVYEQKSGIMCPTCSSPLDPINPLPAPEAVAEQFVDVLKSWLGPERFGFMRKRNSEESDPGVCHSHDFCDANMAMDEAFKRLGVDHEDRWGEDWAASQEAADLWNAAWEKAMPMLGGRAKAA